MNEDNYIPSMTVGAVLASKETKKPEVKKWGGSKPSNCQLCLGKLITRFVDGKTNFGPWAIMCVACHHDHGYGLGTGKGQMYDLITLEKIGG